MFTENKKCSQKESINNFINNSCALKCSVILSFYDSYTIHLFQNLTNLHVFLSILYKKDSIFLSDLYKFIFVSESRKRGVAKSSNQMIGRYPRSCIYNQSEKTSCITRHIFPDQILSNCRSVIPSFFIASRTLSISPMWEI